MKIAVSACLLGEKIRYDGGDKHNRFITDELGQFAEFIPFCPEHLAFGTPRPSIRLIDINSEIKIYSNKNGDDLTVQLEKRSQEEMKKLQSEKLCGIIFKSKSPSCGLKSSKLYLDNGMLKGKVAGIFAHMCRNNYPLLPMEEEGRLEDMWLRENFIMEIFAYNAIEKLKESNPSLNDLVKFHTINKFMLQAKNEKLYRYLGNLVGNNNNYPFEKMLETYEIGFKMAISTKSSIKRTRNVLEHLAGFFKKVLDKNEKEILHTQINDYSAKILPLIVPVSTILLYAHKYDITYLLDQTFLNPYPKTFALRSHISSGK
ncbi:MAG: DUF523 and DUF1722 domain-containing protein [Sulfuricurvum sp.]|uniref:YbgA family protein n=1 Tax=Sulfuricurvum sp. TaxID=2025608 RepID=UPI00263491B7|nr:DUF523 and DUF1722 domain-containing protein [Sulfuricurvum sp.]MDD2829157.1 DUF523 and DUF1722 domain-containing protein [Sulfuricurvum sp.]MDD4950206.1 DUF523 and DUF1722 domain-containing protein [Sulfuricurvum sp.]